LRLSSNAFSNPVLHRNKNNPDLKGIATITNAHIFHPPYARNNNNSDLAKEGLNYNLVVLLNI
jgi:hypothetical protein